MATKTKKKVQKRARGNLSQIHFTLSPELLKSIDAARGETPRNPYIEAQLWKTKTVKSGAQIARVANPKRPEDGRGLRASNA